MAYDYLHDHSTVESLAVADDLHGRIPDPALLFAMKLHSGRTTDTRDLVVISTGAEFDNIDRHVHRGDSRSLDEQIEKILNRLQQGEFENSVKGVFRQETMPTDAVGNLVSFLSDQRNRLQNDS